MWLSQTQVTILQNISLTFYIPVDNSLGFQVTQSFENMLTQHSVVTEYKLLLMLILLHIVQHTGQLYELFLKVFCKIFTYFATVLYYK